MDPVERSFEVTAFYRGMRLDRFLQQVLPRMSRTAIQQAIETRVALASGARAKAARRLVVGEWVRIGGRPPAAAPAGPPPQLRVLAEGPRWLVVDKPGGVASTPDAKRRGVDVATLLGLPPAHRLDRGTSGCLLLSRDAATARVFDLAFRRRQVEKEYVAVVQGAVARDAFVIEAPLGTDPASRVPHKVAVRTDGVAAATRVEVVARTADRSVLRLVPLTGRRHQIRVHLAHVGHPVVGDLLYGGEERLFIRWQLGQPVASPDGIEAGRHLLHARRLAFAEPETGARIAVEAPFPADFGEVTAGRAGPCYPLAGLD